MKNVGFIAICISTSVASSAVIFAARDTGPFVFLFGLGMALLSGVLAFMVVEGSNG
jgi:hypothetical protein